MNCLAPHNPGDAACRRSNDHKSRRCHGCDEIEERTVVPILTRYDAESHLLGGLVRVLDGQPRTAFCDTITKIQSGSAPCLDFVLPNLVQHKQVPTSLLGPRWRSRRGSGNVAASLKWHSPTIQCFLLFPWCSMRWNIHHPTHRAQGAVISFVQKRDRWSDTVLGSGPACLVWLSRA